MKKHKMILVLTLVLTTTLSVFADGEQSHGNRSVIEVSYDAFGTVVQYIYG